jgi:hypothetical protein
MATQRCPKCKSKRIRLGYHPTPLLLKIIFRYNLLCDDCNWEFNGFAIPGTVSRRAKKKNSKDLRFSNSSLNDENNHQKLIEKKKGLELREVSEVIGEPKIVNEILLNQSKNGFPKSKTRFKKKVRVKLHL